MNIRTLSIALAIITSLILGLTIHKVTLLFLQQGRREPYTTFDTNTLSSIEIQSKTGDFPLFFLHEKDRWVLSLNENNNFPLSTQRFSLFLDELHNYRYFYDTGIRDSKIYQTGSDARYTITLVQKEGRRETLHFGTTNTDDLFRYFSKKDNVYRTDNRIDPYLDIKTSAWIDHQPFSKAFSLGHIQSAVYKHTGESQKVIGEDHLAILENLLRTLYCPDITNIPSIPETTLVLELGNLTQITIEFYTLSKDYLIMTESLNKASWIVPIETLTMLEKLTGETQ